MNTREREQLAAIDYFLTLHETIDELKYIADSPAHEYGGFHPQAVKAAKSALYYLTCRRHC